MNTFELIQILVCFFVIYYLIKYFISKRSTFGVIGDLTVTLPNDKNVLYMVMLNPYVTTTVIATSPKDTITNFFTQIQNLMKLKNDTLNSIYDVEKFIKGVYSNYIYTYDKSVTTLIDFTDEPLNKTLNDSLIVYNLCANKTYEDAVNYLMKYTDLLKKYTEYIRTTGNVILNGQVNTPIISNYQLSVSSIPNWTTGSLLNNSSSYGFVIPYPSTTNQAILLQRTASISQNVNLKKSTYVLSLFSTSRPRDGVGDNSKYNMYTFYDSTQKTYNITKSNPIEVSLKYTTITTTKNDSKKTSGTNTTTIKNNLNTTSSVTEVITETTVTTTTNVKTVIGIIIPKNCMKWQQDLIIFDIPVETTYTLTFSGTWGIDDRSSAITDIILSNVTPYDYPTKEYKCVKPISNTSSQFINSTRMNDVKDAYKVQDLINVTGNDISSFVVETLTNCKNTCDVNNNCLGFVFDNSNNKCTLKSSVTTTTPSKTTTLYSKIPKRTYSPFLNKNASGNDIISVPIVNAVNTQINNIDVCVNACDLTQGCKGFVLDKTENKQRCFLKTSIGTTTDNAVYDTYSLVTSKFTADVTPTTPTTVKLPYNNIIFDTSLKITEVVLVFNGIKKSITVDMTSTDRKSAIYDLIVKNYF